MPGLPRDRTQRLSGSTIGTATTDVSIITDTIGTDRACTFIMAAGINIADTGVDGTSLARMLCVAEMRVG